MIHISLLALALFVAQSVTVRSAPPKGFIPNVVRQALPGVGRVVGIFLGLKRLDDNKALKREVYYANDFRFELAGIEHPCMYQEGATIAGCLKKEAVDLSKYGGGGALLGYGVGHAIVNIDSELYQSSCCRRLRKRLFGPPAQPARPELDVGQPTRCSRCAGEKTVAPTPGSAEYIMAVLLLCAGADGQPMLEGNPAIAEVILSYTPLQCIACSGTGRADGAKACAICMEAAPTRACLPCGHFCLCGPCAVQVSDRTNRCPICRTRCVKFQRIYDA